MNLTSLAARIGAMLLLAQGAGAVCAATFTVTRFDDPLPGACLPADCSLREAVIAANALPDSDTILLGGGVYELTATGIGPDQEHGDLDVSGPLSIHGLGSALTTVRMLLPPAVNAQRVFEVSYVAFGLEGLTVSDGQLPLTVLFGQSGGCIFATGVALTLSDVRLTNCQADYGGGLALVASDARMDKVWIDGNRGGFGGGMYLVGSTVAGDDVFVADNKATSGGGIFVSEMFNFKPSRIEWSTGSRIVDNVATAFGGGIAVSAAQLTIDPVAPATVANGDLLLIEGNAAGYGGGGISAQGSSATLEARRIALRGNSSDGDGGGLYAGSRFSLSDSEVLENTAESGDGGGVAVRGDAGHSRIDRVSFARNVAGAYGGAVSSNIDSIALINTSSYGNRAGSGGGGFELRGSTVLQQVTSLRDTAPQGPSVRYEAGVQSHNSVFATGCHNAGASSMQDWGGTAQVTGQPACVGTYHAAAQLYLRYAYFGGRFPIVGITSSTSVLRDAAVPTALLDMRDARNHVRTVPTDVGAYDSDALP